MTIYKVRLLNPEIGLDQTIEVPDDEYILDIAEDYGILLPYGCRHLTNHPPPFVYVVVEFLLRPLGLLSL